jgi:hypothetical protein
MTHMPPINVVITDRYTRGIIRTAFSNFWRSCRPQKTGLHGVDFDARNLLESVLAIQTLRLALFGWDGMLGTRTPTMDQSARGIRSETSSYDDKLIQHRTYSSSITRHHKQSDVGWPPLQKPIHVQISLEHTVIGATGCDGTRDKYSRGGFRCRDLPYLEWRKARRIRLAGSYAWSRVLQPG